MKYTIEEIVKLENESGGGLLEQQLSMGIDIEVTNNFIGLLSDDEELLFVYKGTVCRGIDNSDYNGFLAVTSERVLLYYSRILLKGLTVSSLTLDNIVSCNPRRGLLNGTISIDTVGIADKITILYVPKNKLNIISESFMGAVNKAKELKKARDGSPLQHMSAADELVKYKNLLDTGVITQEEFNSVKKRLLGL